MRGHPCIILSVKEHLPKRIHLLRWVWRPCSASTITMPTGMQKVARRKQPTCLWKLSIKIKGLPSFFETIDKFSLLRADRIGDEFGIQYIIKGAGDEYQRLQEVKATKATLILPLRFPDAYDVS